MNNNHFMTRRQYRQMKDHHHSFMGTENQRSQLNSTPDSKFSLKEFKIKRLSKRLNKIIAIVIGLIIIVYLILIFVNF